jgi:hypothetical protein
MALDVGSRLGHYDVTALIGEGGMGQVFLGPGGITRPYDLTPDGQRFVMIKTGDEENLQITVVLNWFEELTRLVPVN